MRMRQMVFAVALILLASMAASAQMSYFVGEPGNGGVLYPAASALNGAGNSNFAVSVEGRREMTAPVTVCSDAAGPAANGTSFDVGDTFKITFGNGTALGVVFPSGTVPFALVPGGFTAASGQITSTAPSGSLGVSATADNIALPFGATAQVTVTVNQAPTGPACFSIHGLRFDLPGTINTSFPTGVTVGSTIPVSVTDVAANVTVANTKPTSVAGLLLAAATPATTNIVGTATQTLGAGTGVVASTNVPTGAAPAGYANGAPPLATAIQIPQLVQNTSFLTGTGTIVVQQAAGLVGGTTFGGGLLRAFNSATTQLNAVGTNAAATNATGFTITVTDMPVGSSVTFPATVANATSSPSFVVTTSTGSAVTLTSATGSTTGVVTYKVTTNTTAGAVVSLPIPFTVSEATSGGGLGTARAFVSLDPPDSSAGIPRYTLTNGVSVIPSQASSGLIAAAYALYNIIPNTTNLYFTYGLVNGYTSSGGVTNNTYDTGLLVSNTGQDVFGTANAPRTVGQDGTFTFYLFPDKATNGTNTAIGSISSTAANFPNQNLLETGGVLAQGNNYTALLSQIAGAVTGATANANWSGYIICVTNFQYAHGLAIVSQFYNANGGITYGYQANVFAGLTARATPEGLNH